MEGAVLTIHLESVLRQIRKAGLSVGKSRPCTTNIEDIFAELEDNELIREGGQFGMGA